MISFYPGPSKLHNSIQRHFNTAFEKGIISLNHRSRIFSGIIEECSNTLKSTLNIPEDYLISYVSSATECWEIVAQSFVSEDCLHIYNGAFGEKWYNYTRDLSSKAHAIKFDLNTPLSEISINYNGPDVVCLTHSETSNGSSITNQNIQEINNKFPDALVAVDATSSMAGIELNFSSADIWYASVQKCFGLPPGMAVIIFSPKAIERGLHNPDLARYNSFSNIHKNAIKFQTTHTPNNLNIYLLNETLKEQPNISITNKRIRTQANEWYNFFKNSTSMNLLVKNENCYSPTVIAIEAAEHKINEIKKQAENKNIMLGRGYGEWLNKSFRIANFPAIEREEIVILKDFFRSIEEK